MVLVAGGLTSPLARAAAPSPTYTYATMSDGVKVALAVSYPVGFSAHHPPVGWPALFMMDGYEGAAAPLDPGSYGGRYVMVHASIRGTGCSGGRFDLFDRRSAEDGYEIIEHWIVRQKWSNGRDHRTLVSGSYWVPRRGNRSAAPEGDRRFGSHR